jgi:hypothetical protein
MGQCYAEMGYHYGQRLFHCSNSIRYLKTARPGATADNEVGIPCAFHFTIARAGQTAILNPMGTSVG